jgi:glutathione peroxidase
VNVASKCSLAPQYEALQRLYERYRHRGLLVLGTPCDQFAGQEPGDAAAIAEFCATIYQVDFPLTARLEVNGRGRHALYAELASLPDPDGRAGDIVWNFEKFVVSPRGVPLARFRPTTGPECDAVVAAIEAALPVGDRSGWRTVAGAEVRAGDRVRVRSARVELTVTRIEPFPLNEEWVSLVEDSPRRWLSQPVLRAGEVEILDA